MSALCHKVCKMVCEQRTCRVPYTVCKPVQYCRTINEIQCVTKQVPYTVTRCVPKVTCVQVPVQVMVPVCPPCPPATTTTAAPAAPVQEGSIIE